MTEDKNTEHGMDRKMIAAGKLHKIILPEGMGAPLYCTELSDAIEMQKEYGAGARIVLLIGE